MADKVPPTIQSQIEALNLAEEVLRNIELSDIPLANIALKASRIARLLNDFDTEIIMAYEAGGYPIELNVIPIEAWRLAGLAGRQFQYKTETKEISTRAYTESICQMEEQIATNQVGLGASNDPNIAISSSNPHQFVMPPISNTLQRNTLIQQSNTISGRLASRRTYIHRYVSETYYKLKYSGIADDIFVRTSHRVNATIGTLIPDAVKRFSAVYDYLRSDNPEDWSNAVNSCRRVLVDLADAIFPATKESRIKQVNGKTQTIELGKSNHINRIIAFVEDSSNSERFKEVVGSHIKYLGDRLDSVYKAANKGTHETITHREESDRYVIYTYLLVGDVLSLYQQVNSQK